MKLRTVSKMFSGERNNLVYICNVTFLSLYTKSIKHSRLDKNSWAQIIICDFQNIGTVKPV